MVSIPILTDSKKFDKRTHQHCPMSVPIRVFLPLVLVVSLSLGDAQEVTPEKKNPPPVSPIDKQISQHIESLAEKIQDHENLYIIGKSWNYPMALESAIKIQEVSYIHAEGFAGSELKHGPIALMETMK